MKKIILGLIVLAGLMLVVVGCGSSSSHPHPVPTVTHTVKPKPTHAATPPSQAPVAPVSTAPSQQADPHAGEVYCTYERMGTAACTNGGDIEGLDGPYVNGSLSYYDGWYPISQEVFPPASTPPPGTNPADVTFMCVPDGDEISVVATNSGGTGYTLDSISGGYANADSFDKTVYSPDGSTVGAYIGPGDSVTVSWVPENQNLGESCTVSNYTGG